MNKHLALAYGFAGLAVAAALITFVTTSTTPEPVEIAARIPEEAAALDRVDAPAPPTVASDTQEAAVEYVYVDEPARAGRHDEHGDEDDEHDDRGSDADDEEHDDRSAYDDEGEGGDDDEARGGHDDDED